MIRETAARLFAGTAPEALWAAVEDAGFPRALLPDEAGGFGVSPREALAILAEAASAALANPLAETMAAGWLLARAGLAMPDGPLTIATGGTLAVSAQGVVSGTVARIPWGGNARAVVVLADARLALAIPAEVMPGENLAREPRDTLRFDGAALAHAPVGVSAQEFRLLGAALRSAQIAGALEALVAMTTLYAGERVQFGRPIGKFQAVQHNLAILAAQQAAASAAAEGAAEAVEAGMRPLPIAAAKLRCGEAAGIAAALAHQIHGAIGFTEEHGLHRLTTRLWSWRDEFGAEPEWAEMLGRHACALGADALWAGITAA